MEKADKRYEKAKKIAKEKIEFIQHLFAYSIVMIILALINNLTDPGEYQWWLWPATCGGIFVFISFLEAFVFVGHSFKRFEEELAHRELEKMYANRQTDIIEM